MIDIKSIKQDFINYYQFDKLFYLIKNTNPKDITNEEYKNINKAFDEFYFISIKRNAIVGNLKIQIKFERDENKKLEPESFNINKINNEFFDINCVFTTTNKIESIAFYFSTKNDQSINGVYLEINENSEHSLKRIENIEENKPLDELYTLLLRLIESNQPEIQKKLIDCIVYRKKPKLDSDFLESYCLLYDEAFNEKLLNKLQSDPFENKEKRVVRKIYKNKIIKQ